MSGPWEKYGGASEQAIPAQQQEAAPESAPQGPWAKYGAEAAPPEAEAKEPGSVVERAVGGFKEPFVGSAQLIGNTMVDAPTRKTLEYVIPGAGPVMQVIDALVGQRGFEDMRERQNTQATELAQQQREMAPEGVDWARLGGNVAGLAPTAAIGGPGGTLRQLFTSGAMAGAAAGATSPVENAGENYFREKGKDIALGAATGAIANPVAQKVIGAIGRAMTGVKAAVAPKMSPAEIKVQITQNLQQSGIDLSKLPASYVDDVANDVRTALQSGGNLDERALTNMAAGKALGIDLTKGQATQNPSQFGKELFLREAPGGEQLGTQYVSSLAKLNQNIDEVATGRNMLPPTLNVEAGRKALDALRAADKPARQTVDRLYESARARIGVNEPLDQAAFVKKAFDDLQQAGVVDKLPGQFQQALNMLSTGKSQLTMAEAQMMLRAANGRISKSADPVEREALYVFKAALDDTIDSAGTALGQDAATAFRIARQAAAKRFQRIERIPALRDALEKGMAPDDFMKRAVYSAKLDDLRALRGYLRSNDRQAWNQVRSQVLADIKQAATKGSDEPADFSQAAFNKQLNSLRQSGKLGVLFSDSEIKTLEAIARVGRLIQQGPPGVSRTGLGGSAKMMGTFMNILGKLPLLGRTGGFVQAVGQKGANVLEANAAIRPPVMAPLESVIPPEVTGRLATSAATAPAMALNQN